MLPKEINLLNQILSKNGYHATKPRQEVFKLLLNQEPQTMQEIQARAVGTVDRVSVYRIIDVFEKIGIVHRIYIGWKYKLELSDQFISHHHHLSCLKCGEVIDIEDETHIDEFIKTVASKFNFLPRSHQFEVDGYCAECK